MNIPTDSHAEAATLGSVLLNAEALHEIAAILGPTADCFHDRRNGALYEAMLRIQQRGDTPDTTTVLSELGDSERGVDVPYLASLVCSDVTYTSTHATQYAAAVRDAHTRRELLESCRELAVQARDPGTPVETVLEGMSTAFNELTRAYTGTDAVPLRACLDDALDALRRLAEADGAVTGIPTGMPDLDRLTGGWSPGDLVIVAARPSVGKTAFGLNAARHAAHAGSPVFFASLEMDRRQLAQRLLCMTSNTRMDRFTTGWLADRALDGVAATAPGLGGLPLFVDDTPRMTLWDLGARVRRWHRKHGPGLIVVDYLQLLRTGRRYEKRYLEVGEISAGLKALGRELKCPVLALCQLSREAEKERDGFRMLACLREAGSLEQDADLVLILTRLSDEEKGAAEKENGPGACDGLLPVVLAKHRNGPTGRMFLRFDKATQRIGAWREADQTAHEAKAAELF